MAGLGRTFLFGSNGGEGRLRHFSPIPRGSGRGPLIEPTAVARPGARELVFMPEPDSLRRPRLRQDGGVASCGRDSCRSARCGSPNFSTFNGRVMCGFRPDPLPEYVPHMKPR